MNTLITMCSKFGRIEGARYLFDEMPERNAASWNVIMSSYVRVGLYQDAVELFSEMRKIEIEPSGYLIASLVTACSRSMDLINEGFQIHGFVVKFGLLWNVFVGTSLVNLYGANGFVSSAKRFFEEMPDKNVVSWTSLMVSNLDNGDPREAVNLFREMTSEGVGCNQNSLTTMIKSCGFLEDELLGHQVIAHVAKSGFETNAYVANSLISMFGNLGCVEDARYVFDHMVERDTISWNSLVTAYANNGLGEESLRCFKMMHLVHNEINETTVSSLLSVCGMMNDQKWGSGIHGLVIKLGLYTNICVCNSLVSMYHEAGRIIEAEKLFLNMPERDLITWNSMIAGFVRNGKCLEALKLLGEIRKMGKRVNYVTFASALSSCSSLEYIDEGKIVHGLVITAGLSDNLIVCNALITMYGKCKMMIEAKNIFQNMPKKDLVTWNALIGNYAEADESGDALYFFKQMREEGVSSNYITIVNILGACSSPEDLLVHGMPLHAHIVLMGFESDDYVKNSLITMYAKCGDFNSSNYIFSELLYRSGGTWNAMLAANARHGDGEEALKLFIEMQRAEVDLDAFSFSATFAASANLATLDEGQQLHGLATKLAFDSYIHITNAIMDMYGKCGEMGDVQKLLPEPKLRSRMSWNIMISAFARHGLFENARKTFEEMIKIGLKPDHVTFVSLLSACSHGGLVDVGLNYYTAMTKEFGVPAGIEHCVCIIDLLGRSGRFSEAENFIKNMPVPPNDFVWRSLLAACRIHGNLELGQKAIENLLQSKPSDDSAYVLYSNVCAISGKWDHVENVRDQMLSYQIIKQPARSWIKLKHKLNSFGIGDQSHPHNLEIREKLGELRKMISEEGYVPDTSFSFQDTDEEQKEHNLWNHSERLALAYGLISTKDGSRLRIFKNLRVCGDCHSFFKFVSKAVEREIVLRDPFRFHHFHGGSCSCGDYW